MFAMASLIVLECLAVVWLASMVYNVLALTMFLGTNSSMLKDILLEVTCVNLLEQPKSHAAILPRIFR